VDCVARLWPDAAAPRLTGMAPASCAVVAYRRD